MKASRYFLATLGALFVIQGSVQLVEPSVITNFVGVYADNLTGQIELRVIYGGLHVALGVLCLWGALNQVNTRATLTAMLFVSLGVALPRVILGLFYGDFSAYSVLAMTMESAMTVVIIYLLRIESARDSS